jgi:hypothetical protein
MDHLLMDNCPTSTQQGQAARGAGKQTAMKDCQRPVCATMQCLRPSKSRHVLAGEAQAHCNPEPLTLHNGGCMKHRHGENAVRALWQRA